MASNEIAILDPAATVDKLNKIAADRAVNRRRFIAALGIAGAAAGAGLLSGCANNATTPISSALGAGQTDILNFVLNIEYLEATLYAYLTTGGDLSASVTGNGPAPTGAPSALTVVAPLTQQYIDLLNEIYFDELNHVSYLRSILGSAAVPRPAINLAAFGTITATGPITSTTVPALSLARLLKDLGVTAYASVVTGLSTSNTTYLGQILGAESFHSGALRLISIQLSTLTPAIATYFPITDGLGYDVPPADLGTAALEAAGPTASGGFFPTYGGAAVPGVTGSSFTGTTGTCGTNGFGYARTLQQVLQVLYGASNTAPAPHGSFSGGFFPNGVNGNLTTS
jgi:hypothetical protein